MSKNVFASEKVMKNYLSELLIEKEPAVEEPATATKTAEGELRPVARLLEKVNVIERPATAPSTTARTKVEAPVPAAPKPLPTVEELTQTRVLKQISQSEKVAAPEKEYRKGQFQALFFDVAGLTVAVPLTELGGIHNMGKLNTLVGKPDWYMGVMVHREQQLNVVNTAKWVMPEKYDNQLENDIEYQYIIMLDNSSWGLACEKLINTVTLEQEDVKWRESSGRRPWLAGLIKERMCALLDVSALIKLLEQGQSSQDDNRLK